MPTNRTTYRYHFKLGDKIVHTGITHDIDYREWEHRKEPGMGKGYIEQVGFRTTQLTALAWEKEQREQGKPIYEWS